MILSYLPPPPAVPLSAHAAFVVGHQAHSSSAAATTNSLAAAHTMRAPVAQVAHKQQAVAQMAAQGIPHGPIKTQHLEEEEAAAAEEKAAAPPAEKESSAGGDEEIDLMPPKGGPKGGRAKELSSSVEEAFEDKPNPENSHYVAGYVDKVCSFLPTCLCISARSKEKRPGKGLRRPGSSWRRAGSSGRGRHSGARVI